MPYNEKNGFFESGAFIALISVTAYAGWATDSALAVTVFFACVTGLAAFTAKTASAFIPPLMLATFVFGDKESLASGEIVPFIAAALISVLLFAFIFCLRRKRSFRLTPAVYGLCALFVSALLGGVFNSALKSPLYLIGVGATAAILIAYSVIHSADTEFRPLFTARCFAGAAFAVTLEVWTYYLKSPDILTAMTKKYLNLGWGIGNNAALVLLFSVPFILYLAVKSKRPGFYVLLLASVSVTIVFCFSRGCIIILLISALPLVVYAVSKAVNPVSLSLWFLVSAVTIALVAYALWEPLSETVVRFLSRSPGDNGRFALWRRAAEDWINGGIVVGAGFGYGSKLSGAVFFNWYHSSFMQALSNLGLIGLAAFCFHTVTRYRPLINKGSLFSVMALASSLMSGIYGLIDVTYYTPYYLIPMLILLSASENMTNAVPKAIGGFETIWKKSAITVR